MKKKKSSFIKEVEAKIQIEAMSNLRPSSTGIAGVVIWISAGEFEGKDSQHGPKVKVIIGGGKVNKEAVAAAPSVTIKDGKVVRGTLSGKILKQVKAFIELNRETLLHYWDQSIDTVQMGKAIKGI